MSHVDSTALPEEEFPEERQLLPSFGSIRLVWIVYGVFGLLLAATFAFVIFEPIKVLPRVRLAPGYILTDQDGNTVNNEQFRGKMTLYNFTYTRCDPPECRQLDLVMKDVQDRVHEVETYGIPVEFVTISFDPEYDTPEVLKAHAEELGADTTTWHFLTSDDPMQVKRVVGTGFQVYFKEIDDGEYEFIPTMILVDGWGIVRGIYNSRVYLPETERILTHLNVVANEATFSKGANRVGYEAAHLFLCFAD
jgi:protein SCO1/2